MQFVNAGAARDTAFKHVGDLKAQHEEDIERQVAARPRLVPRRNGQLQKVVHRDDRRSHTRQARRTLDPACHEFPTEVPHCRCPALPMPRATDARAADAMSRSRWVESKLP